MSQQINVHLGHCKTFVMATIFLKFGKTAFLKVQLSLYTKLFIILILHKLPSWLGRLVIYPINMHCISAMFYYRHGIYLKQCSMGLLDYVKNYLLNTLDIM